MKSWFVSDELSCFIVTIVGTIRKAPRSNYEATKYDRMRHMLKSIALPNIVNCKSFRKLYNVFYLYTQCLCGSPIKIHLCAYIWLTKIQESTCISQFWAIIHTATKLRAMSKKANQHSSVACDDRRFCLPYSFIQPRSYTSLTQTALLS